MSKLYHLKNEEKGYNEFTTNEYKIIAIYIDELAQITEQNLLVNKNIGENYLGEIMTLCGEIMRDEVNIDTIIKELNNEHNWKIKIYYEEV